MVFRPTAAADLTAVAVQTGLAGVADPPASPEEIQLEPRRSERRARRKRSEKARRTCWPRSGKEALQNVARDRRWSSPKAVALRIRRGRRDPRRVMETSPVTRLFSWPPFRKARRFSADLSHGTPGGGDRST